MKKVYLLGLIAFGLLALSSCNDDNDELTDSTLTYYPNLVMEGDEFMIVPVGTEYIEPGCTGTLYNPTTDANEDITNNIAIDGEVDPNTMGFYYVNYTAVGSDGFTTTVTRTVCVCDPTVTLDISGTYETDMNASLYGVNKNPFSAYAPNYGYTTQCVGITFTRLAPGFFYANDLMGGWYEQLRGFGVNYGEGIGCMTGYVSVDNDGNISLISSYIDAWGDALDYLENGKYDLETGTISYSLSYAAAVFMDVVLNKVQ